MQDIIWPNSDIYAVFISPLRDLSFIFIQVPGEVAIICTEEEAIEGLRRLVAWKKRSRKTACPVDRRPYKSKGQRHGKFQRDWQPFLLISCWSVALESFVKLESIMCFLTGPHSLTSCFPELPYQHIIFYTFSLHFKHLFCVPISSSMSTTHP